MDVPQPGDPITSAFLQELAEAASRPITGPGVHSSKLGTTIMGAPPADSGLQWYSGQLPDDLASTDDSISEMTLYAIDGGDDPQDPQEVENPFHCSGKSGAWALVFFNQAAYDGDGAYEFAVIDAPFYYQLRFNTSNDNLEYSTDGGTTWTTVSGWTTTTGCT